MKSAVSTNKTAAPSNGDGTILQPPPPPLMLRPLLTVYRLVPAWCLPGIPNFNVSFSIASSLALAAIRTIFWELLLAVGWPAHSKMTTDAAASLGSICHSLVLVVHLGICLAYLLQRSEQSNVTAETNGSDINNTKNFLTNYQQHIIPSAPMTSFPKWWQDAASALLELCTGYMMFDTFFLWRDTTLLLGMELSEFDYLVLAHHALTSFYMISCRVVGAGHLSAMILMFTGEITNPFMNGMFVTRFAIQLECCRQSSRMLWVHTMLEHAFAVSYVAFRVVIGPLCSAHVTWDLLFRKEGRANVPISLSLIWVTMIWVVIYGSIPFVQDCLDMIRDGWALKYDVDYDFGERFAIRHTEL